MLMWGTLPTCLQSKRHVGNVPHGMRAANEMNHGQPRRYN